MSLSSPVNCSFISCTADTAVLGSMYSAVLWGLFVYFVWFTRVSSPLVMTRSKKFTLHQELALGCVVMLFTALEKGRIPSCSFLAIAFTWWAECLTAILIQQLGSVVQVFRNKALEQLRQRPRPDIKSPVCWEREIGDMERMCWPIPWWLVGGAGAVHSTWSCSHHCCAVSPGLWASCSPAGSILCCCRSLKVCSDWHGAHCPMPWWQVEDGKQQNSLWFYCHSMLESRGTSKKVLPGTEQGMWCSPSIS